MNIKGSGESFPASLNIFLLKAYFRRIGACDQPRSSVTELLRHAPQGLVSHHQCHKLRQNPPCWKSGWIRMFVKAMMGRDDPIPLPTCLPPSLSSSLILYCMGQVVQSLKAYIQTRMGHQGMWCQEGQDSSFLALSMIDSPCPPPSVQANFLELKTLNPDKYPWKKFRLLLLFLRNRPCIITYTRFLS